MSEADDTADDGDDRAQRYLGKYRGTVINNVDPEQRGRILAMVPDVQGLLPLTWALPCVPIAGKQEGSFMVPQVGAGVWIEFEQGDPDYPIWVGGFWGSAAEVPLTALTPTMTPLGQNIVFQTSMQHLLAISDAAPLPMMAPIPAPAPPGTGGIVLRSPSGAMIVVNDAGIFINNGKGASIELVGLSVAINKLALVVT
ncbi:MAG: phage baseplate assembly protein V [Leptothrix sp. (in: b-proteobacteria)]